MIENDLEILEDLAIEIKYTATSDMGDPRLDARASARAKAATLSLEEQISLLRAADFWRTVPIPEKGIPAIKTSDGPNGARGGIFTGGTRAALFPCGVSLAATWNASLIHEVGNHLAEEVKARSADVLLAPTVCLHRGPLGGRNFESFSEDPILTGKLAVAYINGVQEKGIAATIKHFVANEEETDRFNVNSQIEERPLRELYLRPFEIAIRESNPWAVMSSYNQVNGVHADMNTHTLKDILRGEWAYDGLVMSDWTGVNSTAESIEAGCDLEMPVGDKWRGEKALQAVKDGKLSRAAVEKSAANVLYLIERVKGYDMTPEAPEREDNTPERRALIRRAGTEGITLLKNEAGLLPIKPTDKKIAVIGPNAARAIAGGGGSASLNPYYSTLPLDSIKAVEGHEISHAIGAEIFKWLPVADKYVKTADGTPGVTLEFHTGDKFEGKPTVVEHRITTELFLWDSVPKEVGSVWSVRAKTILTPPTSGNHVLSFSAVGPGRLFVDGKKVADLWDWTEEGEAMFGGSADVIMNLQMEAGKSYEIVAESSNEIRPESKKKEKNLSHESGGMRIGFKTEDNTDHIKEAVELAKASDIAIIIVGLDAEWESEGYDRKSMDLPKNGSQDRLIEAVLKANPKTIVINQSGSPITMPWASQASTIVQAWYQGQEAGNSLTDVLFGKVNPSGKLPTTFPVHLSDNPTFHNWPGENGKVVYGEGMYIGYRHYDAVATKPLFAFGHGLSYTTFSYGKASTSSSILGSTAGSSVSVTIPITNTGKVAGAEIVQAYIHDVKSRLPRPIKELAAFGKVFLEPGETKDVTLTLDKYSIGYYDTSLSSWIAEEGTFEVWLGASSIDIRQTTSFEVEKSFTWIF